MSALEVAPEDVELRVCEECGRTDRYRDLPFAPYHYVEDGRRCHGDVVVLTYRRVETDSPPAGHRRGR